MVSFHQDRVAIFYERIEDPSLKSKSSAKVKVDITMYILLPSHVFQDRKAVLGK